MSNGDAVDNLPIPEMRVRIYHAIYHRTAVYYVRLFPSPLRRIHEFLLLTASFSCILLLMYTQHSLKQSGRNCLANTTLPEHTLGNTIIRLVLVRDRPPRRESYYELPQSTSLILIENAHVYEILNTTKEKHSNKLIRIMIILLRKIFAALSFLVEPDSYEVEFALEYGLLHLSNEMRQKLNIPTLIIEKSPDDLACFGNKALQLIQDQFLGQRDHMVAAYQFCFERYFNETRGRAFAKIRSTGDMFTFSGHKTSFIWYPAAYFLMVLFTLSISLLIRFTHHQIFVLFVELVAYTNDAGPVFSHALIPIGTAVLALIGVESVVTEFFKDSISAFFIVILVWMADHFYHICCRTDITKKYWMVFFYLYQYVFYINQIKYNGFFNELAFLCTLLFVAHSMLFALNHYELPALLHGSERDGSMDRDT